jgi:hypothetical protein
VATEKNSTIVFPVPIDLLNMFVDQSANGERPRVRVGNGGGGAAQPPSSPESRDTREGTVS